MTAAEQRRAEVVKWRSLVIALSVGILAGLSFSLSWSVEAHINVLLVALLAALVAGSCLLFGVTRKFGVLLFVAVFSMALVWLGAVAVDTLRRHCR
jgi:hypothetical protein